MISEGTNNKYLTQTNLFCLIHWNQKLVQKSHAEN